MNRISIAVALTCVALLGACEEPKKQEAGPADVLKSAPSPPRAGVDPAALAACKLAGVDYEYKGLKDRFLVGKAGEGELTREAIFARRVLHVNTDGAANSYHADVIAADKPEVGALNLVCNAGVRIIPHGWVQQYFSWLPWVEAPKPIKCYGETGVTVDPAYAAAYLKIKANDWKPADGHRMTFNWDILGKKPETSGHARPCVDKDGFFTSMTKLVQGKAKDSCDQSVYIDANSVPAFVLPQHWFAGWAKPSATRWASFKDGDVMVGHIPAKGARPDAWVYAIVGDAGPIGKLGEGSIALNWALKGESGDIKQKVRTYKDVVKLDSSAFDTKQIPFLVLEGTGGELGGKFTPDHIRTVVERVCQLLGRAGAVQGVSGGVVRFHSRFAHPDERSKDL